MLIYLCFCVLSYLFFVLVKEKYMTCQVKMRARTRLALSLGRVVFSNFLLSNKLNKHVFCRRMGEQRILEMSKLKLSAQEVSVLASNFILFICQFSSASLRPFAIPCLPFSFFWRPRLAWPGVCFQDKSNEIGRAHV